MQTQKISDKDSKDKDSKDLDKLVGLAEQLSDNIKLLNKKIFRIKLYLILSILLMYILVVAVLNYKQFTNNTTIISIVFLFALISLVTTTIFIVQLRQRNYYRREIEGEIRVLKKLMLMISELKDTIALGIIEEAIIEIRLSRIDFSQELNKFL